MGPADRFRHYEISRTADGQPVELARLADERVFLAFDMRIKRLVELHVLNGGEDMGADERRTAWERMRLAAGWQSDSFLHIIECGEDGGVPYYASALNDGEWLDDFIARLGALPQAVAFSLTIHLLEDLISLADVPRLLGGIRLNHLLVTLREETYLSLRVVDLGLSAPERLLDGAMVQRQLVRDVCRALFAMLTGKAFDGDDCDGFPVLTNLPSGLRVAIRGSLGHRDNGPPSLERMRDEVRDALGSLTRDLQGRASRRHLVAPDALLPRSSLREVLLHEADPGRLPRSGILPEGDTASLRHPFAVPAADARTGAPLTVHFLPPRRIVAGDHYDAVPLQIWRFDADKHPNILRSLRVWESPDQIFLTEERGAGFALGRLLAERQFLNPLEVLLILRQVKLAMEQAQQCGMDRLDLHPCNIVLRLSGAPPAREIERLLQKRLEAWPRLLVMLRPHLTMRALYEPLLAPPHLEEDGVPNDDDPGDGLARSYIALAAFLMSGTRQAPGRACFPDSVPESLTAYLNDCLEKTRHRGLAPEPRDFLAGMERLVVAPEADAGGAAAAMLLRGIAARAENSAEPPESAGAISDFEIESASLPESSVSAVPQTCEVSAAPEVRGVVAMLLRATTAGILLFILWIFMLDRGANGARDAGPGRATVQDSPAGIGRAGNAGAPEEIRRALLPSEEEKAQFRREQRGSGQDSPGLLVRDENAVPTKA